MNEAGKAIGLKQEMVFNGTVEAGNSRRQLLRRFVSRG
jgi:hypothetical protein